MNIESLLRTQIKSNTPVPGKKITHSPDFCVSVQNLDAEFKGRKGVHVTIRASDHNTLLDLFVSGNDTSIINT